MSWDGLGNFRRLYSWLADAAAGIDITASRMDNDTNNITTVGFGNCLTRDGQGSATANLPMNGFKHTGAAPGVDAADYVTMSQLTGGGAGVLPGLAQFGDIKPTALADGFFPDGWHPCSGGTRPRTDPLWVTYGGGWAWGNGNGTTTYTLPDLRGRGLFGKDDMGGTPANRITGAVAGFIGTALGAAGGDQHAQADPIVLVDPGHAHTTPSPSGSGVTAGAVASFSGAGTTNQASTTNTTGITVTSGLTGAAQNMPPAAIVNFIIFTGA